MRMELENGRTVQVIRCVDAFEPDPTAKPT